jgi:hypothetical protein
VEEHQLNGRELVMFLSGPAIIKVKSFSLEGKLEDLYDLDAWEEIGVSESIGFFTGGKNALRWNC